MITTQARFGGDIVNYWVISYISEGHVAWGDGVGWQV